MRVYRLPLTLFMFGVVGIVLMVGAADVMFGYWLSIEPDATNGVLTTRGLAQQRGDVILGGAMLLIGVVLFLGAVAELIRRKPVVEVSTEGLQIDLGTGGDALIPWGGIESISSAVVTDEFDGSVHEHLVVELIAGYMPPDASFAMVVDGSTVLVDANDWSASATEVMLAAQGALEHSRRVEAALNYEPPSIVWTDPTQDSTPEQDVGAPHDSDEEPEATPRDSSAADSDGPDEPEETEESDEAPESSNTASESEEEESE